MGAIKEWAKGLSQEEQEEFLSDPATAVLRLFVSEQVAGQRRKLLDATRTRDLETLRRESGYLDGLLDMQRHLEEDES